MGPVDLDSASFRQVDCYIGLADSANYWFTNLGLIDCNVGLVNLTLMHATRLGLIDVNYDAE